MKYSLFIMVMKEMMSMEAKGQMGAAPAASPLLSSQYSDLYYMFSVSLPPCRKITRLTYIVDFRSRQFHRAEVCSKRTHKAGVGPTTRLGSGLAWWVLFSTSWDSPLYYSQGLLFLEKITWQKIGSVWHPEGSWKSKNMQKQGFLLCRVKTKIKAID
jgi:hypothetical protein